MPEYIKRDSEIKDNKTEKIYIEYPIRKAWKAFDPNDDSKIEKIGQEFNNKVLENRGKEIIIYPDYAK